MLYVLKIYNIDLFGGAKGTKIIASIKLLTIISNAINFILSLEIFL